MHLIKDENGNLIQHGHEHTHQHTHADGVSHTHAHTHDGSESHDHTHNEGQNCSTDCGGCQGGDCRNETVALLTYMLQHNEHHAAELDQMADNLAKMGMDAAAKTIKESVSDFQKGNMRLGLALTLVKEEMKEGGIIMCLATVYKENDDSVIFKNVSRINVDGNKLVLRDIMGDERVVEGTILMVDLANSIVKVKCD